jgi:hypothetical protein
MVSKNKTKQKKTGLVTRNTAGRITQLPSLGLQGYPCATPHKITNLIYSPIINTFTIVLDEIAHGS